MSKEIYIAFKNAAMRNIPQAKFAPFEPHHTADVSLSSDVLLWYRHAAPDGFYIPWHANDLYFFKPSEIAKFQAYYIEAGTNRAVSSEVGDWQNNWVALGEIGDDPIISFANVEVTPILLARHGMGFWRPVPVAPTLSSFIEFLTFWIERIIPHYERFFVDEDEVVKQEVYGLIRSEVKSSLDDSYIANIIQFMD